MSTRIMGIDPSVTSFGWVILDADRTGRDTLVAKGRIQTYSNKEYADVNDDPHLRDESLLMWRYRFLEKEFRKLLDKWNPVQIGSEAPPIGGGEYSEGLFSLYVQNMKVIMERKVDTVFFAPEQLKLLAFVEGRKERSRREARMFKKDMIEAALGQLRDEAALPLDPEEKAVRKKLKLNNDEADAFHCAWFGFRFRELMALRRKFVADNPLDRRGLYLGYGDEPWEQRFQELAVKEIGLTVSEVEVFLNRHTYTKGVKAGTTEYKGVAYKPFKRFFELSSSQYMDDVVGRLVSQEFIPKE